MVDAMTSKQVGDLVNKLSPSILQKIGSAIGVAVDQVRGQIAQTFSHHLEYSLNRSLYVKTILEDHEPRLIREVYVRSNLRIGEKIYPDDKLSELVSTDRKIIVRGTAGAGKTMLMKILALDLHVSAGMLPIFVNLRDLKNPKEESFQKGILRIATPGYRSHESNILFYAGLRSGLFTFLLDGLDEIRPEYRGNTLREIDRFPFDFPNSRVVISTRPETNISAFESFKIYSLEPFNITQTKELISRSNRGDKEKEFAFIKALEGGLFERMKSFSSVPLLCLLMFMSFSNNSEVPEREAEFYDQAFETLFYRHDSSKGPFRRTLHSELEKVQFRKLMELFGYLTIIKGDISFSDFQLRTHLGECIQALEYSSSEESVITDLMESVCLMYRDGGRINFIHRSFQEYFAASFLAQLRHDKTFEIIDRALMDSVGDHIAPLLMDLNRPLLEKEWVLPAVRSALESLNASAVEKTGELDIRNYIKSITILDKTGTIGSLSWNISEDIEKFVDILDNIYEDILNIKFPIFVDLPAVPGGFKNCRDFILNGTYKYPSFRKSIADEDEKIQRATRERKPVDIHRIRTWELDTKNS